MAQDQDRGGAGKQPGGEIGVYLKEAEARLMSGDLEGAARALEAAGAELIDRDAPGPKRHLAQLMALLGDHRLASRNPGGALESYRAALSLAEGLSEGDADPAAVRERAFMRYRLGTAELAMGRGDAALQRFQLGCLEIATLSGDAPEDASLKRDLSASRSMLGDALSELGQYQAAIGEYGSALALAQEVDGADPAQGGAQAYMATLYRRMAGIFEKLGRPQEAITALRQQAEIIEGFRRIGGADPDMVKELIEAYRRLARLAPGEARGPLAAALDAAESLPPPGGPTLAAQIRKSLEAAGG